MAEERECLTLSAQHIQRFYGTRAVVRDLTLQLRKGEVLGLLGPNGAGKTTTLRMITGNLAPSGGSIEVCGVDLLDEPQKAKAHIGYLPEMPPLYFDMTVNEYLRFAARLHRIEKQCIAQAVEEAKKRCGLTDRSRYLIGNLSKGLQQRVGIAQAIIHEPDIIILDEPTVGLDPNQMREMRTLIRDLGESRSVILSTHILSEVESVCDRVQIMHEGRMVLNEMLADFKQKGADLEAEFTRLTQNTLTTTH
ncbi:ABC transporter ATP-binding protein [Nitrosomonas marina]|uniref:ABC-2 type transport system ATP-binding protein n=1 Tax=Nitrosomonas marina TaxID=917 RepID=A0A1H8CH98_9PROT|nr:ABC transporter ATP-binding protein [Nitrosomonas marina]SEM93457.1 ABC-2 type transport system ATP-binding protein [Nitrosomonas marina]